MEISEPKTIGDGSRQVCDVIIEDGSVLAGKTVSMKAVFFEKAGIEVPLYKQLRAAEANKQPVAIYGLNGKHNAAGWVITSTRSTMMMSVPAGVNMKADHTSLTQVTEEQKQKLEASDVGLSQDYKGELAMCSTVALLQRLATEDAVPKGSLFQVNWCELVLPQDGSNIKGKSGQLWFRSTLRDLTGVVDVWVREVAALDLVALTKDEFLEAAANNKLSFPLLVSCRVVVSPSKNQDGSTLVLVEAAAQDLAETPRLKGLVEHMKCCAMSSATTWPCRLAELEAHPLYNFAVNIQGIQVDGQNAVHCQRALVLVKTKKSTSLEQIEGGFKVVTPQIQCGLDSSDASFSFRSICLLEQSLKFRMDPVRPGDYTYAFAVLTGKAGPELMVGDVLLLRPEQVDKAKENFESLLRFAESIAGGRVKRDVNWTPESSKKCRKLSRSPTET